MPTELPYFSQHFLCFLHHIVFMFTLAQGYSELDHHNHRKKQNWTSTCVLGEEVNVSMLFCLQVLLLDSSLHLFPPVLVIPSPSDVLLGTGMESPSGEWMGAVSVICYIAQQVPLVLVGLAVLSQLHLWLGLEQVLLPSHQHWVALQLLHWMVLWLSALDQALPEMLGTGVEAVHFRY